MSRGALCLGSVRKTGFHRLAGKPSFLWQSALIILPVLALAAIGLALLRQDRARVESDLRLQAQSYAERLADFVERELVPKQPEAEGASVFVVGDSGDLLDPKPIERVPVPQPLDLAKLSESQRRLWQEAVAAGDSDELWSQFTKEDAPREFQGQAWYRAGLSLKNLGRRPEAADAFQTVSLRFGDLSTPAGLPIRPLAQMQWIETATLSPSEKRDAMARCLENALADPSPIVPQLLERIRELEESLPGEGGPSLYIVFAPVWERQQTMRALHADMLKRLRSGGQTNALPDFLWFEDSSNAAWLAIASEQKTNGTLVVCKTREEILRLVKDVATQELKLPSEFGASVDVAGHALRPAEWESSPQVAGSAERARGGRPFLVANVHVTDPAVFASRVRARLLWYASLIGAAALAAGVGLVTARRAFHRQQALADMKTNFVSSVSHELRAPIASIRLLAEGLERGATHDSAKQREYFRFIVQECRRLSSLIENVLDFSRIEHGRNQYEFDLTDATTLVRQTVALMEPYAAERGVSIVPRVQENVVMNADARAIQQALVNLIDNAIKHSPTRSEVVVGLETNPAHNGQPAAVEFRVEDSGEGIPSEDHERIFERFYRRGSELRRETQGVGIGLSIVKHIVEAHGGSIHVVSAVAKGSRFTIQLPGLKS
jgi:signal transduction histidine kinase